MDCTRVNVTLNKEEMDIVTSISKKKKISKSAVLRKALEMWIEDNEDKILLKYAMESEKRWIENGCKTISHEEMWNLDDGK